MPCLIKKRERWGSGVLIHLCWSAGEWLGPRSCLERCSRVCFHCPQLCILQIQLFGSWGEAVHGSVLGHGREKLWTVPVHLCRHPPVIFLFSFHGHNFHRLLAVSQHRLMTELLEERVNSVVHFPYRELHSDRRSSTFVFDHQLLSYYFICIVSVLLFRYHARLTIISWEEVLKQNFTNVHFTNLHFYIKVSFLLDSFLWKMYFQ